MAIIKLKYPFDLPSTYYRGIGEIIARTARFENSLMDAIAAIVPIDNPKKKRVMLMSMSVKPKLGILKAMANNWVPAGKLRNEFLAIIKESLRFINFRHYVAHGIWGVEKDKHKKKFRLSFVEEPKDVYMPSAMYVRSKELLLIAQEIKNLDLRLGAAVQMLKASHAPSPDKPQAPPDHS